MSQLADPPAMPDTAAAMSAGSRWWQRWLDFTTPHVARGPFARWPRVADAVLATVVFGLSVIAVAASAVPDGADFTLERIGDVPIDALVLLAVAAASLWWRRDQPVIVAGVVLVTMVVWAVAELGDGHDLALVVALYSVGRYLADPGRSVAVAGLGAAISLVASVIDGQQRVDVAPALLLTLLPWYIGRRIRNRGEYLALLRERAARLEAEQHAEAERAVADERARIARELHDVVAHRVSMMTVQAGAARTVARDDPDAAVEAMGDVERAGRATLGELRHLLGVLRPVRGDEQLEPQPGLDGVTALIGEVQRTGAEVELTIDELPADLPAAIDLSAYRIVQESLTNAIKHGGSDPHVLVVIVATDTQLAIDVVNTTPSTANRLPPSGYGIAGMRERVQLFGGTLTAERCEGSRFHVAARIPLEQEAV